MRPSFTAAGLAPLAASVRAWSPSRSCIDRRTGAAGRFRAAAASAGDGADGRALVVELPPPENVALAGAAPLALGGVATAVCGPLPTGLPAARAPVALIDAAPAARLAASCPSSGVGAAGWRTTETRKIVVATWWRISSPSWSYRLNASFLNSLSGSCCA